MSQLEQTSISSDNQVFIDMLNGVNKVKKQRVTRTKIVERPVIKEVLREVEADCPPCPPEKDCPPAQVLQVDTLKVKGGGDILVKPKSLKKVPVSNIIDVGAGWIMGEECEINTPREKVSGRFAVTSLSNIAASHLPPSFEKNPNNPCNERRYRENNQEQGKVIKNAKNFDPKFLINDDNTAENGAIIVDEKGVVLGGNGRTMTLLIVVSEYHDKYEKYYSLLLKKCSYFGIDKDKISGLKNPVLVRVVHTDKSKSCEYYSRIFNESMKLKMDSMDMALGIIKSLGKDRIRTVAREISEYLDGKVTSLSEVMKYKDVVPGLILILEREQIINDTNRVTFIDENGYLTDEAVGTIENMFYALVFDNRNVINYITANDFIKIEQVFGLLLGVKTLDKPFNILPSLSTAVEKMKAGKSASMVKQNADDLYAQQNLLAEYQVSYLEYLWMKLLEMRSLKNQTAILKNYINLVKAMTTGFYQPSDKKEVTPENLLRTAFDDAKVKVAFANLGDKKTTKKKKTAFPCTLTFTKEETIIPSKNQKREVTILYCKSRTEQGSVVVDGWNINDRNVLLNAISLALKDFLVGNGYFPKLENSRITALISSINKKYKMHFETNFTEPLNYENWKDEKYFLKSKVCEQLKAFESKFYEPMMFDKKQSLGSRISNWFKKDLKKKYRWEV